MTDENEFEVKFSEEEGKYHVKVDKDNLDVEWETLPDIVYDYGISLGNAILKRDRAKNFVDHKYALIYGDAEDNPDSYGLKRVTDATLKQAVIRDQEYQDALDELAKAQSLVSKLWGALRALDTKREATREEVKLYGMNYFAEENLSERVKDRYKDRKMATDQRKHLTESIERRRSRHASTK